MNISKRLIRSLLTMAIMLLITVATTVIATYAWYIYQINAHTTSVHMNVGTGISLQISDSYTGHYSSNTTLKPYVTGEPDAVEKTFPRSLNPVSTDIMAFTDEDGYTTGEYGFQKVLGFTNGRENQTNLVANLFSEASLYADYYHTSIFIKTKSSQAQNIYLSSIDYDGREDYLDTAVRVGFVIHEPGAEIKENADGLYYGSKPVSGEYIFQITEEHNPDGAYNTNFPDDFYTQPEDVKERYVLDSQAAKNAEKDENGGYIIQGQSSFSILDSLYGPRNFVTYVQDTAEVILKDESLKLFSLNSKMDEDGNYVYGEAVEVEIFVWLEGCDKDCTNNLCGKSLNNLSISFACAPVEE